MKVGGFASTYSINVVSANFVILDVERLPDVPEEVVDEVERLLNLRGA